MPPADALPPPTTPGPLRERQFRWFFAGQSVSRFGSAMTPVALAFAVLGRTDDPHWLGYVLAAEMVPMVALLVVGGGLADRYRREVVLRVSNAGAGLGQAGVAAVVLTGAPLWLLLPPAVLNGALDALTTPALRGIVPDLVPAAAVQRANSLLGAVRNGSRLVGPAVAGVLAATVGGGWGIALDAASFLVAALCLLPVRLPARPTGARGSLPRDLREGWGYFRSLPWLWTVSCSCAVLNAVQMGIWQVLGPTLARHGIGAPAWGAVQGVRAGGLLLFSLLMLRWTAGRPLLVGLCGLVPAGLPLVLLGTGAGVGWLGAAVFLAGSGSAVMSVLYDTTLQTRIPRELLSRVSSIDDFFAFGTIPLGQLSVVAL
ncbi:MFS transporter, partial [Kitasatospora sp. NPDC058965]|uniref:MFS transporter n=1 Tax=Kitasatospora sp. NPDC058965 TaxID=3346682 RepID=UPI00368D9A13